jgi:hypothetical protein
LSRALLYLSEHSHSPTHRAPFPTLRVHSPTCRVHLPTLPRSLTPSHAPTQSLLPPVNNTTQRVTVHFTPTPQAATTTLSASTSTYSLTTSQLSNKLQSSLFHNLSPSRSWSSRSCSNHFYPQSRTKHGPMARLPWEPPRTVSRSQVLDSLGLRVSTPVTE